MDSLLRETRDMQIKVHMKWQINILNHIIASGFCSKTLLLFESHDASVT